MITLNTDLPLSLAVLLHATTTPTSTTSAVDSIDVYLELTHYRSELKPSKVYDAFHIAHGAESTYRVPFQALALGHVTVQSFVLSMGPIAITPYIDMLRSFTDSDYGVVQKLISTLVLGVDAVLDNLDSFDLSGDIRLEWEGLLYLRDEKQREDLAKAVAVEKNKRATAERHAEAHTNLIAECESHTGIIHIANVSWTFYNAKVFSGGDKYLPTVVNGINRLQYALGYDAHGKPVAGHAHNPANYHPETGIALPRGYLAVDAGSTKLGFNLSHIKVDARAELKSLGVDYGTHELFKKFQPIVPTA